MCSRSLNSRLNTLLQSLKQRKSNIAGRRDTRLAHVVNSSSLSACPDCCPAGVLSGGGGPVLPPGVGVGRGGIPSELFDFLFLDFCFACSEFFPQARCEGLFRGCSAVFWARFNKNNRAAATGLTAGSIPPLASLATKPVIAALDLLCGCGEEITLTENISVQDLVQTHYIERFPQLSALAEYVGRQVRACCTPATSIASPLWWRTDRGWWRQQRQSKACVASA